MQLHTPVLFCVFNRPELTRQVFAAIRAARPRELLIVQDGPRPHCPGDSRSIAEVRQIVSSVDWACTVHTQFASENLGCRQRMASGIQWGFERCERLIILEDDCWPSPTFFEFCELLLDRYADEPRVHMISGNNFQPPGASPAPFYFSKYAHIWGWASWARAWRSYDVNVADWPRFRDGEEFHAICPDLHEREYWREMLDLQRAGGIDSWDFPWMFAGWQQRAWTILPAVNLVSNLGFGAGATHTTQGDSPWASLPWGTLDLTAVRRHSLELPIVRDAAADQVTWERVFRPTAPAPMLRKRPRWRQWWRDWTSRRAGGLQAPSPSGQPTCR